MRVETLVVKVLGLLMLVFFVWDSKIKYDLAEDSEGEKVRIKFVQFQNFLLLNHLALPQQIYDYVDHNTALVLKSFAAFQFTAAILFYIGSKTATFLLITCTLLQTSILHNPLFKKLTEVDRQRAER